MLEKSARYSLLGCLICSLLIVGCDPNRQNSKDPGGANDAKPPTSNLNEELEAGLSKQFGMIQIPRGDISVLSAVDLGMTKPDPRNKLFPNEMLNGLEQLKQGGLIDYTVYEPSFGGDRTRVRVTVTPLKAAIDAADPSLSTSDALVIVTYKLAVSSIVKDVEYHHPALPQSDDFRLVVGTFKAIPRDLKRPEEMYKFRAMLKVNPFNKTYSFQIADVGSLDDDLWKTQNIPN